MMDSEKEQIERLLKEMSQKIREDHFSKGLPIVYMKGNWIVEEWPDGRIVYVKELQIK